MAITSLSLLLLAQQYRQNLVRQVNRRSMLLSILRKQFGSGKNVPIPLEFSGQGAGTYTEGADVSTFGQDTQAAAVLGWGLYEAPISISNLAVDAAASTTAGPAGNEEPFGRQIENGVSALCSAVNVDLYQGAAAPAIIGLGVGLGSVSTTYAGLDRSQAANALFRPNVFDPGSPAELTLQTIRQDLAICLVNGGVEPDFAMATPAVFNTIAGLVDPLRRFETDTLQTASSQITLAFKVSSLVIDTLTILKDKDASYSGDSATVGSLTYLNSEYVDIELLMPEFNTRAYQALYAKGMVPADDGMNKLNMAFYYEALAKTGSATKARVALTAQLRLLRPNAMGIRRNIAIKQS